MLRLWEVDMPEGLTREQELEVFDRLSDSTALLSKRFRKHYERGGEIIVRVMEFVHVSRQSSYENIPHLALVYMSTLNERVVRKIEKEFGDYLSELPLVTFVHLITVLKHDRRISGYVSGVFARQSKSMKLADALAIVDVDTTDLVFAFYIRGLVTNCVDDVNDVLPFLIYDQLEEYVRSAVHFTSNTEIFETLLRGARAIELPGDVNYVVELFFESLARSKNETNLLPLFVRYLPSDYDAEELVTTLFNFFRLPTNFEYHLILAFPAVDCLSLNIPGEKIKLIKAFYDQV